MLSKEEIEEGKAHLWWMLDNGIFTSEDEPHIEAVLEYIEQLEQEKADRTHAENYEKSYISKLESDKQKLIEKLEGDIVNITKTMQDGKHCDDYSRCRLKAYRTKTKEILSILKGENHEKYANKSKWR